jgi:hypothetical protein
MNREKELRVSNARCGLAMKGVAPLSVATGGARSVDSLSSTMWCRLPREGRRRSRLSSFAAERTMGMRRSCITGRRWCARRLPCSARELGPDRVRSASGRTAVAGVQWNRTRTPKKIHQVNPEYPSLPPNTRVKSNTWVGEILLDRTGAVSEVWTIREMQFSPPFPAFSRAVVDAVWQWRFEPATIDGKAIPVCMTTTVRVDFE